MKDGVQEHSTNCLVDIDNILLRQSLENEEIYQYYWNKVKVKGILAVNKGIQYMQQALLHWSCTFKVISQLLQMKHNFRNLHFLMQR